MPPAAPHLVCDIPAFAGLTPATLEFLADRADTVHVCAGDLFFDQGDPGSSVYVIEAGRAAVDRTVGPDTYRLRELGPGDCFGEIALLSITHRTAAIRALDDCVAVRISARQLRDLYEHDLEQFTLLVMNLGREVCRRFVDIEQRYFEQIAPSLEPHEVAEPHPR